MSSTLSSLVQAAEKTGDLQALLYVINNLGRGVPPYSCFAGTLGHLRLDAMGRLIRAQWQVAQQLARLQDQVAILRDQQAKELLLRKQREMMEDQLIPILLEKQERQLTALLFQQASLNLFIKKLVNENAPTLQKHLKNENALVRLLAVTAVGRRHLHLERDLIERLSDPHPDIRDAARHALVRVARGTDFGPIPGASRRGMERSTEKWRRWLALQQSTSSDALAKDGGIAADKPAKVHDIEPIQLVLERDSRELNAVLPEVAKLRDELVNAKGDEQISVLARLRDAKGIENTDALALAIPKLSGDIRKQARNALAQRLTRMTAATLRDKLQEDGIEVRRAAALACGRKDAKEHIPDLLQLLDDPERDVIQAARVALSDLSGEDFGPAADADHRDRVKAVAAWRRWWNARQSR